MATDESVIKKRLLIEGDGGGDDKRISSLLKTMMKWSSSTETTDESDRTFEKLQSQLSAIEFSFAKANLVYGMNVKENENYEELYAKIDDDLRSAVVKIEESKKELEKAKVIRKNRQEYDQLAKVINEHPDRQATIDRIAALEKEHSVLKNTKAQLERKLEQRRRQFHLLVTSIHQLQTLLDEDDANDDPLDEQLDDALETDPTPVAAAATAEAAVTTEAAEATAAKVEKDEASSILAENGDSVLKREDLKREVEEEAMDTRS